MCRPFTSKGARARRPERVGTSRLQKSQQRSPKPADCRPGKDAISPPTFDAPSTLKEFRQFADEVRERSGGIPIGFKLSANHIEADIDFAVEAGADYIILDGRGGGTGAAPLLFRDHISVPTIPALARARAHLDRKAGREISLIITGGLRMPEDFIKAMAMGADGIALANSAIQAIGCVAARICNTNNCPTGIATQKPELRRRLDVEVGGETARDLSRHLHPTDAGDGEGVRTQPPVRAVSVRSDYVEARHGRALGCRFRWST